MTFECLCRSLAALCVPGTAPTHPSGTEINTQMPSCPFPSNSIHTPSLQHSPLVNPHSCVGTAAKVLPKDTVKINTPRRLYPPRSCEFTAPGQRGLHEAPSATAEQHATQATNEHHTNPATAEQQLQSTTAGHTTPSATGNHHNPPGPNTQGTPTITGEQHAPTAATTQPTPPASVHNQGPSVTVDSQAPSTPRTHPTPSDPPAIATLPSPSAIVATCISILLAAVNRQMSQPTSETEKRTADALVARAGNTLTETATAAEGTTRPPLEATDTQAKEHGTDLQRADTTAAQGRLDAPVRAPESGPSVHAVHGCPTQHAHASNAGAVNAHQLVAGVQRTEQAPQATSLEASGKGDIIDLTDDIEEEGTRTPQQEDDEKMQKLTNELCRLQRAGRSHVSLKLMPLGSTMRQLRASAKREFVIHTVVTLSDSSLAAVIEGNQ